MKTFAVIAAATTLFAQTFAYSTEVCPIEELAKLFKLTTAPGLSQCQDATELFFVPPSGYPTDDQIFLMCITDDCHKTLDFLAGLEPADCMTNFAGVSLNVRNISDSFKPKCKELGFEW